MHDAAVFDFTMENTSGNMATTCRHKNHPLAAKTPLTGFYAEPPPSERVELGREDSIDEEIGDPKAARSRNRIIPARNGNTHSSDVRSNAGDNTTE